MTSIWSILASLLVSLAVLTHDCACRALTSCHLVTLPGSLQIEELFKHALHRRLENSPRMPDDGIYLPSDLLDNGLHDFHHTVKRRFSSTTSDPVKLKVARQGLSFADIVDGFLLMDMCVLAMTPKNRSCSRAMYAATKSNRVSSPWLKKSPRNYRVKPIH